MQRLPVEAWTAILCITAGPLDDLDEITGAEGDAYDVFGQVPFFVTFPLKHAHLMKQGIHVPLSTLSNSIQFAHGAKH